ncbi:hypothetical protein AWC38_SpisGene6257 [Stylophora pistillata]|uniref:Ig-like domain-containing protein n=1 Tax=Stylophora pistillata TaxID=50429 RepID=A0A2B4SGG5_STYPI|nr:hypothetical protein AWC38_SpisGene6257 [Stylophora pistillata]
MDLRLDARVQGYPYPRVTWSHDELVLKYRTNVDSETSLKIRNVTVFESGIYSCYAKNPFGHDSINFTANISVQEPLEESSSRKAFPVPSTTNPLYTSTTLDYTANSSIRTSSIEKKNQTSKEAIDVRRRAVESGQSEHISALVPVGVTTKLEVPESTRESPRAEYEEIELFLPAMMVPTDRGQNPNYAQASSACSHTYTPLERNLPQVPTNSGQNTDYAQASSACSHTYAPLEKNLPKAPIDSGPNPEYAQASSAWSDVYASLERNKEGEQQ